MKSLVTLPMIGVNDESALVVVWHKKEGEFVHRGEALCAVETTKAVMDIEAEAEGYLVHLIGEGKTVAVGEPLAALTESQGEDISELLKPAASANTAPSTTAGRRWTKKAELLAKRSGIDLNLLSEKYPQTTIGEAEVMAFQAGLTETKDSLKTGPSAEEVERVLILGGARGGGAALVLDALAGIAGQYPVGILDRDPALHGQSLMGVPVLGSTSMAMELWEERRFDGAVIAFNANLDERAALFEDLSARGLRFTNIIDVTAIRRLNVHLGVGNVVLASCYFGPYAKIGDNNFLSAGTHIEHHCNVGNHCAFGPAVAFSGRVHVGSKVRFGTNIAAEPDVVIGDDCVIASGSILTRSIPANSIVKARFDYTIRPRH